MMNVMMDSSGVPMMQGYNANWSGEAAMGAAMGGGPPMGGPPMDGGIPPWMANPYGEDFHPTEPMKLKFCEIIPRKPGLPLPSTRERPEGCRTVFVGGVPEWVPEKVVRDVFDFCGEIESVRFDTIFEGMFEK